MSEFYSREEMNAMVETQVKATEQLVMIAERLRNISENQVKITERLHNGMARDIADHFIRSTKDSFDIMYKELKEKQDKITKSIEDTRDDSKMAKWFFGILSLVIVICTIIFQFNGVPKQPIQQSYPYQQSPTK